MFPHIMGSLFKMQTYATNFFFILNNGSFENSPGIASYGMIWQYSLNQIKHEEYKLQFSPVNGAKDCRQKPKWLKWKM